MANAFEHFWDGFGTGAEAASAPAIDLSDAEAAQVLR